MSMGRSPGTMGRTATTSWVPYTQLDFYLLRQLAGPLLFGVAAFSALFMGSQIVEMARLIAETGAPAGVVIKLFLLRLPQVTVWTFPMAVLLGVLLTLSRLSAASEVVAMYAGGVSFRRLAAPVIAVGLLMTLATLAVNEGVVPQANRVYQRVMVEEVQGGRLPTTTRNVILKKYSDGILTWFLYSPVLDGHLMRDVTVVTLNNGRPTETTYAEEVFWDGTGWYMRHGTSILHGQGQDQGVATMQFRGARQPIPIDQTPKDIGASQRTADELSARELAEQIQILRSQGQEVRRQEVDLHLKLAIPMASLVFSMLGTTLGVQSHRSASGVGFGLSIVIIFVYYVIMTVGTALGQSGQIPPALGAWLQNLILGAVGVILMARVGR